MVKIVLILMVKNEGKIIERCLKNINDFVEAFAITDTGSEDNTVSLAEDFIAKSGKPGKVFSSQWKNFGYSRSISFDNALEFIKSLGWDLNRTYGLLLDADMILKYNPKLKADLDNILKEVGYRIPQKQGRLEYDNTRFVRMSENWKCVGVTHEYWTAGDDKPMINIRGDAIWIDDISDGGCKSDKFTRDIRLLTEGLAEEPTNARYMFYLAQSYNDSMDFDNSIKWYKKRIKMGGWHEEVWFAHLGVARGYAMKQDFVRAENWILKGYQFYPKRSENLHLMVRICRALKEYYKAWHYYKLAKSIPYPEKDMLFVDYKTYNYGLDLDGIILWKEIFPEKKEEGMKMCFDLLSKENKDQEVLANSLISISEFAEPLKAKSKPFLTELSCNTMMITKYKTILNIGSSDIKTLENNTRDGIPSTKNYLGGLIHLPQLKNQNIFSLQMIDGKLQFISSIGTEFIIGDYYTGQIHETIPATQPVCIPCENYIIRRWKPFTVREGKKERVVSDTLPFFFSLVGSNSDGLLWKGKTWFLVYMSLTVEGKSTVLHSLITIEGCKPVGYSFPFYFKELGVEHVNSFSLDGEKAEIIITTLGKNPYVINIPMSDLEKLIK